jgi:hypothetical protein
LGLLSKREKTICITSPFYVKTTYPTFLPTQEQLQGVAKFVGTSKELLNWFSRWVNDHMWETRAKWNPHEPTMTQLWLAFVMHELYQKTWDKNKEDWV